MKLVEILARELATFPISAIAIVQNDSGRITEVDCLRIEFSLGQWDYKPSNDRICDQRGRVSVSELATDHATAIVTREQWQAERRRIEAAEKHAGQWNGKGLPPTGTTCEVWHDTGREVWHKGVIIGPHPELTNYVAVAITKGSQVDSLIWSNEFRPIDTRTPREKWIDAAHAEGCPTNIAALLFDAGLAKIPD